jgi:hypothetical protein
MARDPVVTRRWIGAIALLTALVMLICGETVLKGKFGNLAFLAYWLGCLACTVVAIIVALADARAVQRRISREQRNLLESTVKEIEVEAKHRRDQRRNRSKKP